jgi:hypothetical protein
MHKLWSEYVPVPYPWLSGLPRRIRLAGGTVWDIVCHRRSARKMESAYTNPCGLCPAIPDEWDIHVWKKRGAQIR